MWQKLLEVWKYNKGEPEMIIILLLGLLISIVTAGIVPVSCLVGLCLYEVFTKLKPNVNRWMIDRQAKRYKPSWKE
jgi:hypothetical protein